MTANTNLQIGKLQKQKIKKKKKYIKVKKKMLKYQFTISLTDDNQPTTGLQNRNTHTHTLI